MYKIYADDVLIYDDTSSDTHLKVVSPQLSLEDNCAGSLKMTIPPGNAGYETIQRMMTEIRVTKDDNEIWSGRVLQESKDFWNQRSLVCEGELAYLNDTTQPQELYEFETSEIVSGSDAIKSALMAVIAVHDEHAPLNKQFVVGNVTVDTTERSIELITNYEKTIECINKKFLEVYGGHLKIRKEDGNRYLDYVSDELISTNTQTIEFGRNLMDFTKSFDSSEYATVIVPLGKRLEDQRIEGIESYLTVEGVEPPRGDGTRYVKNQEAINERGWIEKVVHWDNESHENNLYTKAQRYLSDLQFDTMMIELSAFDLHYYSRNIEEVKVGDRMRVISKPHGLDRPFIVKKLDIPLDQPQNTKFQLGNSFKTSLTEVNNKINAEIKAQLEKAPLINSDKILSDAQEYTDALMHQNMNGYITILSNENGTNEQIISESRPVEKNLDGYYTVQRLWRFDMHGLGYSDDYGRTWKTAITMDGMIIGERIAAGSIHGSKITAGSFGLVSEAGPEKCTLKLEAIGIPGDALEIGTIVTSDGTNTEGSGNTARTKGKYYLTSGKVITINDYQHNIYRYGNDTTAESGYSGSYWTGSAGDSFTVPTNGYYRIVVNVGRTITDRDLTDIATSIDLGQSTVFSSADIRINGMVTFTNLADPTSVDGSGSATYIDGGHIKANSIEADCIKVDDLYIKDVYATVIEDSVTINKKILTSEFYATSEGNELDILIGNVDSSSTLGYINMYSSRIQLGSDNDKVLILSSPISLPDERGVEWTTGKAIVAESSRDKWYLGTPKDYFEGVCTDKIYFNKDTYLTWQESNNNLILFHGSTRYIVVMN